jgi:hypothetical protein
MQSVHHWHKTAIDIVRIITNSTATRCFAVAIPQKLFAGQRRPPTLIATDHIGRAPIQEG